MLGARNQFVPPKLSVIGIDQWVKQSTEKIVPSPGELARGGAISGGLLSVLFIPEPVTVLTTIMIGALLGVMGKPIEEQKISALKNIMREFDVAISQIDRGMKTWAKSTPDIVYDAAVESFGKNVTKLSGYLTQTTKRRLALPSRD